MQLHSRLLLVLRVFIGLVFSVYGVVKIFGGQFYYGDWSMTRATVDGPGFVWAFYGYSPYYGRFIGFCELIPALMLFLPRTATLGAAMLFPVALNITVMDFFYGFPSVKWMVLLYTTILGILLYADRGKLFMLLEPTEKVQAYRAQAATLPDAASRPPLARPMRIAALSLVGLFVLFLANLIGTSLVDGPEVKAEQAARVASGSTTHWRLVRSRYSGLFGINRHATVLLVAEPGGGDTLRVLAHRASGFTPWRIDSVSRVAGGGSAVVPNASPSRQ